MSQLDTTFEELGLDELRSKEELSPEEAVRLVELEDLERQEILGGLAKKITALFSEAANARLLKEQEWIHCQNLYNSPLVDKAFIQDDPFVTRGSKRRPVPNIVRTKCDAAVANSYSLQFAAGEKNWDIFPPANNMSAAISEACRGMENEMQAQLDNCNYPANARKAMEDRVQYGTGILKGPVNTGKQKVEYVQEGDVWIAQAVTDRSPTIEHVPIWRFFPDMSVTDFEEGEHAIETHSLTPIELKKLATHPGFDGKEIKAFLRDPDCTPQALNAQLTTLKEDVWNTNPYLFKKTKFLLLEYHGPVTYDALNKMGIELTFDAEEETMEFYGEVWVLGGKIIRMEIENIEGYFETPYAVSVWKRDPSSVFGFGHPLLLSDPQRVITQTYHMILDNAALTSGPQVAMYKKYIQPVNGQWELTPNKAWLLTDPSKGVGDAIQFFTPTNNIGNIMPVLNLAKQFADEESATNGVATGNPSPNNVDSATGQLLMQHAGTTLLDFQSEEWDDSVTEKIIRRMYAWNMQFNPKQEIKGNYVVDVKSASEYKNKQMYVRDLERLSMEVSQNPALQDIVDMGALQRARLQLMQLPDNKIIYSPEESAQMQQQRAQQPDPAMIEMQLKEREIAVKEQEMQLRAQQLQFEQTQVQRREEMNYQEKMGSNQARLAEAQARVLEGQANERIEMLKLAQKGELAQQQMQTLLAQSQQQTDAKVFLAGMQQQTVAREQDQTQQELNIKREMGTGI